ncbi:MAG: deoxynucleoside kinase [bacterium]|nr:deoxynucleoside kinase [bacterium]
MEQKKNYYIAMAGIMGSGKTTVAKLLSRELGFTLFEETVAENSFLPLFYKDARRWAFHNQLFYLHDNVRQLKTIQEMLQRMSVVQDSLIHDHYFTYTKAQLELGHMLPAEFALYEQYVAAIWRDVPIPDLIIQLDASVSVLAERIQKRSRDFEKEIDTHYLETLSRLQGEWVLAHPHLPILSVAVDHINLASGREDQRMFIGLVRERLGIKMK